ncbi:concanavalin A-like lectin/glucanase [Massarina eburnea CBS 473.64]|uniref:Endo-1,4-beta-xylanase n=1 Tax=Massarina eburnea CBS 473.64 TaxID=1395130 RepID=A0A6A6SKF1_9PLEO|nr:concanavalin A-like lectin/glucanase [Massarina eburnea CBS 473.64]
MFSTLLFALALILPAALTAPPQLFERQGYYWSFWQEGGGSHQCSNGNGGSYTAKWSGGGGFVCGKGWSPGGSRTVKYSGTYTPTGPGYLAIYGWTTGPLIEYYIVENHGDLAPGEPWTLKGNFTFEEGTYNIYQSQRVNKPSIQGTSTFYQFWSVRTEPRSNGTVTTGRHFSEWQKVGMRLGNHNYMILATEGFSNKTYPVPGGSCSMTLS